MVPELEPMKILLHSSATIPPCIKAVLPVKTKGVPTVAPVVLLKAFKFLPS